MISRFILIVCGLYLAFFTLTHINSYTSRYDGDYWMNQYQHSQYFQGDISSYILSDADTDAIRGYEFVVQKKDPNNILPGHPFLGTYLIGLSILLFGNPNVTALLAGLACLFLVYQIIKKLTGNSFWASIGVALVLMEPLFREQLTTSMLDIYLLMFSLAAVSSYISWLQKNHWNALIISQLCLGFALATKFFPATVPLWGALYLTTILTGNFHRFIVYTISLIFVAVGFMVGHITYFWYHPSLVDFVRFERYIISWWAGTTQVSPGGVWDLIFRNRWHTWWGDFSIQKVETWWIGWPIASILSVLSILILGVRRRWNLYAGLFLLWIGAALTLDTFQAVYPRHLLAVFIAMYVLIVTVVLNHKPLKYTKASTLMLG